MVSLYEGGVYLVNGTELVPEKEAGKVEVLTGKRQTVRLPKRVRLAYSNSKGAQHNGGHGALKTSL